MRSHLSRPVWVVLLLAVWATGCSAGTPTPAAARATATPVPAAVSATPRATPPPAQPTMAPQLSPLGGGSKQTGDYTVSLLAAPNPPVRGNGTLEAVVSGANGQPVTDAKVSFDLDMTNMSHGKNIVVATSVGNGRYSGQASFLMPGPWRVIVTVERSGQPAASVRFDFTVNMR